MNWLPGFHLEWLNHVPHGRHHLPTTIVWNSPVKELIGSLMVSSFLLPASGTLFLLLYFQLPSTFLPSKGKSITTLGTRWHDFFYYLFRYFLNLFYPVHCLSFPFLRDADSRKGTLCPFCVPIHIKKRKKLIFYSLQCFHLEWRWDLHLLGSCLRSAHYKHPLRFFNLNCTIKNWMICCFLFYAGTSRTWLKRWGIFLIINIGSSWVLNSWTFY